MLRNREIRVFLLFLCAAALVLTTVAALFFSRETVFFVLLTAIVLIGITFLFTVWRYRKIEELSGYLRRISAGDYSLDVRDNHEGELSILKSDIYKVTQRLSEQSSQLQRDKLQLTDAISDISHQLKTPLTSMMMMADLLSSPELEETKRREFTRNIQAQLERIEWLVLSLLKLSKIDAGTAVFKKDKIAVKDIIQKAAESVLIPIDIKQQVLEIKGDESVSFLGDFNWTAEAIINILKNSVDHTGSYGKIVVHFTENALFTEINIKDDGEGIPKQDLPYIFKRFYKGKNAREDSVGIGLAMAYSIISSQNGDIAVDSKDGNGTCFVIKFYKQTV